MSQIFQPNLSFEQIRDRVDQLITPERADAEARAFAQIVTAIIDGDTSDECHELAMVALHHAYQKTIRYNEAFEAFCGIIRPDFSDAKQETVSDTHEHVN